MVIDTEYYDAVLSEAWVHIMFLSDSFLPHRPYRTRERADRAMIYDKLIELGYISVDPQASSKENQ